MFRLRLANTCVRRFLSACPAKRAAVLDQLQACSSEEQVLEVVGKSQAMLEVKHVGCAVGMLWRFQKAKPDFLRSVGVVKSHPQFLTLRVLAESNVSLMDDCVLVDMLYDCRSVSALVSPGLTDALLDRVGCLLDSEEPPAATPLSIRRAVQFMRDVNLGRRHRALLEKCDRLLLPGIHLTNAEHVCIMLHHYRALHFTSWQFRLAAKQRLTELMDSTTDPWHFAHLFEALYPMASPEVGERSLQRSSSPRHVAMLVRVLTTLPRPRLEPASMACLDAVLPQCDLRDLSSLARAVARVMVQPHRHHHHQGGPTTTTRPGWAYDDPPMRLLQELSRCGRRRLGEARSAHTLLGELQHAGGEWFEETLLEPAMAVLQAMSDQIRLADHFKPHIGSFNPHELVLMAYALVVAGRFPEELMGVNRALCLEHPQLQIHKVLSEVLGGADYTRALVITPYFYTARSFCNNSRHMMGEAMMRKRHLEIMGYRVVQIPHFEWNSMELSTEDSLKGYLKKKLFTESSSSSS
ncbi:hypothetical protein CRUP_011595 [Coryphaenoides rupestris]|nr:hypothetical protein CRUP_011595 [Coryphaenoides rupestris]